MITNLTEARTLSTLTDRPHVIEHDGRKFVAFAGIVLPLSCFSMIFMWSLAGSNFYHKIFQEQADLIKECIDLNPDMPFKTKRDIGPYFVSKYKSVLARLKPDEIEELLDQMFYETTTN